jgi:hypothetical protein
MSEFLRKTANNKLAALVGGLAIGTSVTAGIYEGVSANQSNTCESPPNTSMTYNGDSHASDNQATWKTGIEVDTKVPAGSELILGFANAGSNVWRDSNPIVGDIAKKVLLKIGPGTVAFRTELKAKNGSAVCESPPNSHFSEPQPVQKLLDEGAVEPTWPARH